MISTYSAVAVVASLIAGVEGAVFAQISGVYIPDPNFYTSGLASLRDFVSVMTYMTIFGNVAAAWSALRIIDVLGKMPFYIAQWELENQQNPERPPLIFDKKTKISDMMSCFGRRRLWLFLSWNYSRMDEKPLLEAPPLPAVLALTREGMISTYSAVAVVASLIAGIEGAVFAQVGGVNKPNDNYPTTDSGPVGLNNTVSVMTYLTIFFNVGAAWSALRIIDVLGKMPFYIAKRELELRKETQLSWAKLRIALVKHHIVQELPDTLTTILSKASIQAKAAPPQPEAPSAPNNDIRKIEVIRP
ncbi:hypothetical protein FRC01_003633 [Tulasnella sp. 417]|nr:hypothetical protein FRC01_003633 [Tulasnella sp. 417]